MDELVRLCEEWEKRAAVARIQREQPTVFLSREFQDGKIDAYRNAAMELRSALDAISRKNAADEAVRQEELKSPRAPEPEDLQKSTVGSM